MLLSFLDLCELIEQNIIDAPIENVNAASIDLTLDSKILFEQERSTWCKPIDLANKESIDTHAHEMTDDGYILMPGAFILASTRETFNLPDDISAEYKLKSSMARNGLEHLHAGWADAGFHGAKLTLELKNMTEHHVLRIRPNMPIGQMVFFRHQSVPKHASYATKGRYNGQTEVTASKGIK